MAQKREAEDDLLAFVRMMWPVLEPSVTMAEGWVLDMLSDIFMSISDGAITRACINVPPGSMKSSLLNVFLPAWLWGPCKRPSMRFLSISYSDRVPVRDNFRFARLIQHPIYQQCWGDHVKLQRHGAEWVENQGSGWKAVTSVSGSTTGLRGDILLCLPAEALILTDVGWLPIGRIVNETLNVRVAGWNGRAVECQDIRSYQRNPAGRLVRIDYGGGFVRCTPDHPVYVEGRGYVPAQSVRVGDCLKGVVASYEHDPVPGMRGSVLSGAEASGAGGSQLLHEEMCCCSAARGEKSGIHRWDAAHHMQLLREGETLQTRRVPTGHNMFPFMQNQAYVGTRQRAFRESATNRLRRMWQKLSAILAPSAILLSSMFKRGPFQAHLRRRQRALRPWGSQQGLPARMVRQLQEGHSPTRWQQVHDLSEAGGREWPGALYPSYRLPENQPHAFEPDLPLSSVPRHDARQTGTACEVARRVVTTISQDAGHASVTYNLDVGPHHNYFANGILLHNCDDLNNPANVESETVRNTTARFVREIMPSRLNDLKRSAIINLQQRTHEMDATGVLLQQRDDASKTTSASEGYTFISVPAEFDPLRICSFVLGEDDAGNEVVWTDPRALDDQGRQLKGLTANARGEPVLTMGSPMAKAEGTSFWPERFPHEELQRLKITMTQYSWDSQFNQVPGVRGGSIIRREWWRLWKEKEYPPLGTVIISVDTAYEQNQYNDYNAVTAWGAFPGKFGEPCFLLLKAWQARVPLAELVTRVAETCREHKADYLLVEHASRGRDLHDEIVRQYMNATWETVLVKPEGDKASRLMAVSPLFSGDVVRHPIPGSNPVAYMDAWEGGCIYAPDRDWADEVISQVASFPYAAHDDYVDTVSMCLAWCRHTGVMLRRVEWDEAERRRNTYRKAPGVPYVIKKQA